MGWCVEGGRRSAKRMEVLQLPRTMGEPEAAFQIRDSSMKWKEQQERIPVRRNSKNMLKNVHGRKNQFQTSVR